MFYEREIEDFYFTFLREKLRYPSRPIYIPFYCDSKNSLLKKRDSENSLLKKRDSKNSLLKKRDSENSLQNYGAERIQESLAL